MRSVTINSFKTNSSQLNKMLFFSVRRWGLDMPNAPINEISARSLTLLIFAIGWAVHGRRFWHATHDCVEPYIDIILHRGRFWAKSAPSGSVRWCCFRSCWTVLSHVMRGRPNCLVQSARGEANRILLASALSSMRIICPNSETELQQWVWVASLASVHHRSVQIGTIWCQAAYADSDTTGRVHRSYVRPS